MSPITARAPEPLEPLDLEMWLDLTACAVVWAGLAVDYLDVLERRRRSELLAAARRLRVAADLVPTPEAQMREWREKKDREARMRAKHDKN